MPNPLEQGLGSISPEWILKQLEQKLKDNEGLLEKIEGIIKENKKAPTNPDIDKRRRRVKIVDYCWAEFTKTPFAQTLNEIDQKVFLIEIIDEVKESRIRKLGNIARAKQLTKEKIEKFKWLEEKIKEVMDEEPESTSGTGIAEKIAEHYPPYIGKDWDKSKGCPYDEGESLNNRVRQVIKQSPHLTAKQRNIKEKIKNKR